MFHNQKIHFHFFWNAKLRRLEGGVLFDSYAEGPPSRFLLNLCEFRELMSLCGLGGIEGAHGAAVATVFDEILAYPGGGDVLDRRR